MKTKILSVLLACLMVLTLVSCGEPEVPSAVQEFADFANEELALGAPDGIEFKAEAHGTEIVYKYKFVELDSTIDADKKEIDVFVESRRRKVAADFEDVVELCPEVTKVVHSFFDKNDVFICSLMSDDPDAEKSEVQALADHMNSSDSVDDDEMHCEAMARGDSLVYMITLKQVTEPTDDERAKLAAEYTESMTEASNDLYFALLNSVPSLKSLIYEFYDANGEFIVSIESVTADEGDLAVLEYVAAQKELLKEESSDDVFTCDLSARRKSFVYEYTFNDLNDFSDEQKKTFAAELEKSRDSLSGVLTIFQSECPAIESLIYEYYSTDGDFITSIEIK